MKSTTKYDTKSTRTDDNDSEHTVSELIDSIGFGWYQVRNIGVIGLFASTEAIEILLLTILGPSLQCYWQLASLDIAVLTMTTLGGIGIGGFLFGTMSDLYGRLPIIRFASCVVVYFGLLTSLSPSHHWLVAMQGLTGMGIGGMMSVCYILYTELSPSATRARGLLVLVTFWAVGTCTACLIAWLTLAQYGWRCTVAICTIPAILSSLLSFTCLEESPYYLVCKNQPNNALRNINLIAKYNGKPQIETILVISKEKTANNLAYSVYQCFSLMINVDYRRITFVLLIIWFTQGFTYYGNVILSAILPFKIHSECKGIHHSSQSIDLKDNSCCRILESDNYQALAISAFGELISFPVSILFSDTLGRLWSVRISAAFASIFPLVLGIVCPLSQWTLDILLLLNRTFVLSLLYGILVYTSEVYPTSVRTISLGSCQAMARLGSLLTPLVAQLLLPYLTMLSVLSIYSAVAFIACLTAFMLNIETKGRSLSESVSLIQKQSKG